jgi:hypothetical protein
LENSKPSFRDSIKNFFKTPLKDTIKENKLITGLIAVPIVGYFIYYLSSKEFKKQFYIGYIAGIRNQKLGTKDKNKLHELYNKEMEANISLLKIENELMDDENYFNKNYIKYTKINPNEIEEIKLQKKANDYIFNKIKEELTKEEYNEFISSYNIFEYTKQSKYNEKIQNYNFNFTDNIYFSLDGNGKSIIDIKNKLNNILSKFTKPVGGSFYEINKSLFKNNNLNLHELILYENGLRNDIGESSPLITVEQGLVHKLYKILETKDEGLLKDYYLSLLNYKSFLTAIENIRDELSEKEIDKIEEAFDGGIFVSLRFKDKDANIGFDNIFSLTLDSIYKDILSKKLNFKTYTHVEQKQLNNESFFQLIKENIDTINNILRSKYKKNNLNIHINILKFLLKIYKDFNVPSNYLNPEIEVVNYGKVVEFNKVQFSNDFLNKIPVQYLFTNDLTHDHYSYIIYSSNEEKHKEIKKFMEDWYNWINKKYVDFIKIKFIENKY